jgi:hypothetical protein
VITTRGTARPSTSCFDGSRQPALEASDRKAAANVITEALLLADTSLVAALPLSLSASDGSQIAGVTEFDARMERMLDHQRTQIGFG